MFRCYIPTCQNLSKSQHDEKVFIVVPEKERKLWLDLVGSKRSIKTRIYCCEDHFDLKTDTENFSRYMLGERLKLKPGILPHKYLTSPLRDEKSQVTDSNKMYRKRTIAEIEVKVGKTVFTDEELHLPSSSSTNNRTQIKRPYTEYSCSLDSPTKFDSSASLYIPSGSSLHSSGVEDSLDELNTLSRKRELLIIEHRPKLYLGLPDDMFYIIKKLGELGQLKTIDICICLKKIRLNDSFERIGLDFGLSKGRISTIFNNTLPMLSSLLQELIFWPERQVVINTLPISFRRKYFNVYTIIDCFEIQIEKSLNAENQAATYSLYKKCNTIKYLIACTPDGRVVFISEGYGGRISDLAICRDSGFFQYLPKNVEVMCDRGFKEIDTELRKNNCSLVRPPSVSSGTKSTKEEVKIAKEVASLRIHVERVIGRIREFDILKPHATVDTRMVHNLNHCCIIACGIINLQSSIIKK